MKFILTLMTLFLVSLTYAGVRVGNGGDAIVCYNDSRLKTRISIEMFDYWEQSQINNYGSLALGRDTLTVKEKISLAIRRIERFDPRLSNEISTIAFSIAHNINDFLVTQSEIPEITDANPKAIPDNKNCLLTQFAIQWQNTDDGIRRFYISKDLYNDSLTSTDTQAGLILHEAFYRYAITNGAINSDGVRFFNYVSATAFYETAQLDDYVDTLKKSVMNFRGCYRLGEPFAQDLYIDTKERNCFQGNLNLNSRLKLYYQDNQLFYEPSTQAIRADKNIILLTSKTSAFAPLQKQPTQLELRKNLLILDFNKFSDPKAKIDIPDFKFNSKILSSINCINKMTYDLDLDSVVECEIQPHFIQLPYGSNFIAWRRILYDGLHITFNFQQPAYVEMSVPSRSKILIDPSYPAVFNAYGSLVRAISLNKINYVKNGMIGYTTEFDIVNNQLQFTTLEKINPLYMGMKIITTSPSQNTMKICKLKSTDFKHSNNTLKREYILTPEKVYNLDNDTVHYVSDTHANVIDSITCYGDFWVDRNLI
jgi:hypothetical protein